MSTFDSVADFAGDAIAAPASGLWRAQICVNADNQYSMEVPNYFPIFLTSPELPDVTIEKTDGVTTVTSPGTTTYTLTITNDGPGAAMPIAGPEVVDTLPPGLTATACTVNAPLVGTCSGIGTGVVSFELESQSATTLAYLPGAGSGLPNSGTLTVTASIPAGIAGGTTLTNVATVDWTDIYDNEYDPIEAEDIDDVIATESADLSLTKSVVPVIAVVGDSLTYTLTLTNDGPDTATNVEVTDDRPAGITYNTCTPSQGTFDIPSGVWTVGTLTAGQTETLTCYATLTATGAQTNTAEVTASDQPDPDSTPDNDDPAEDDQDSASVNGAPVQIDLSLEKDISDPSPAVGDTIDYTLTLTNAGPDTATNVVVTDDLPTGVAFVNAVPSQGAYDSATGVWTVGTLTAGQIETLTLTVTVLATGSYSNYAEITDADQLDPDSTPANGSTNEDDDDTVAFRIGGGGGGSGGGSGGGPSANPIITLTDPALAKLGDPANALLGEIVTWRLTISNPGSVATDPTTVNEPIPSPFDIIGVTTTGGTVSTNGNTVTVSVPALQPGASIVVTITTVSNSTAVPGRICNTATMGSISAQGCVTLFPRDLPATGGRPVPTVPVWGWMIAAAASGLAIFGGWQAATRRRIF